jgi:hypothetical protein
VGQFLQPHNYKAISVKLQSGKVSNKILQPERAAELIQSIKFIGSGMTKTLEIQHLTEDMQSEEIIPQI